MAKTVTVDWNDFFQSPSKEATGESDKGIKEDDKSVSDFKRLAKTVASTSVLCVIPIILPELASTIGFQPLGGVKELALSATTGSSNIVTSLTNIDLSTLVATTEPVVQYVQSNGSEGWDRLIEKVMWITDYLMEGVIIFSGISWMFGHRTKAIELLFSSGIGYVIIRHHDDIKNFFALL